MAEKLGFKGAAYWGVAGANPATLLPTIISVTPDESKDKVAANDRSNPNRHRNLCGRRSGSVDIEFTWHDDDVGGGLAALQDAYDDDTLIALKFLDEAGGSGWYADFHVFNYSRQEPADGPMTVTVNVEVFQGYTRV